MTSHVPATHHSDNAVQAKFLAILPKIADYGRIYFRRLKCFMKREEAVAEMIALTWHWFVRLARRGKDATQYPAVLASFAARAVRCGRRLCGGGKTKDALSSVAQQRHRFTVSPWPEGGVLGNMLFEEALQDNTTSPVPEQVCFRLDFPRWRASRSQRDRRVIDDLMYGERTQDVAKRLGLSSARISQLRRQLHRDWKTFCQEESELRSPKVAAPVFSPHVRAKASSTPAPGMTAQVVFA